MQMQFGKKFILKNFNTEIEKESNLGSFFVAILSKNFTKNIFIVVEQKSKDLDRKKLIERKIQQKKQILS